MRMKLLAGASAAAMMSVVVGSAMAATPANILVIGTDVSSIPTLDPAAINARTVSEAVSNLYDNLVQLDWNDMVTLKPMLAESWTVSPDGRTITLELRKNAKFVSGNPVTAEDAAWTIHRIIKQGMIGGTDLKPWGFTPANVEQAVRATGPTTLVIEPPEQVSAELVLYSLAGSSLGIVDKKAALPNEKNGDMAKDWLKSNVTASGAFKLVEWRPNDILIAERRDDYWAGAPKMRRVIMRHTPESGSLRLQLEGGDVDIGHYVNAADLQALEKNKDIVIEATPGFGFYYIALNQKDPILANPKVREAFQYMLDWDALAKANMRFLGFPFQSMIPKGMPGASAEPIRYRFDLAKAKQLLTEAGYPNGFKKKLFPAGDDHLINTESLQATAKQVGVELEIIPGRHVEEFRDRKFETYMGNAGARLPDPFAVVTQMLYNPDNRDEAKLGSYYAWRTSYDNPAIDKMIEESKAEKDPEKRKALYEKINETYMADSPPVIPFFQRSDPYVWRTNVKGYHGHPTWSTRWLQVTKD